MKIDFESGRQSGRTTRMLTEAVKQAAEGRHVFVITATNTGRTPMMAAAKRIAEARKLTTEAVDNTGTVKLYVGGAGMGNGEISFHSTERPFDWRSLRMLGAHPSTKVLVDHYALELEIANKYGEAIRQVQQWEDAR